MLKNFVCLYWAATLPLAYISISSKSQSKLMVPEHTLNKKEDKFSKKKKWKQKNCILEKQNSLVTPQ